MSSEQGAAENDFESIGTCFMQDDGSLILRLRATGGPVAPVNLLVWLARPQLLCLQ
jgi:hypothetical protein